MKKVLLLVLTSVLIGNSFAQTAERKWAVGLNAGTKEYYGDLGSEFWTFINNHGGIGLDINRYLNSSFSLTGTFSYGVIDFEGLKGSFSTRLYDYNLGAKYKFNNGYILKEEAVVAPYLFAGAGATYSVAEHYPNGNGNSFDLGFPVGLGIRFKVSDALSVELRSITKYSLSDQLDANIESQFEADYGDVFNYHSIGITYNFGGGDKDEDGVADKDDKCPDVPGSVEANGCPDEDKDGVADIEDSCKNIAGTLNGCPDADGDLVADKDDPCPKLAGTVNGCPDSDLDGVADINDKCPDLVGGVKGCPDRDEDGINDDEDVCPDEKGTLATKGCPDADSDGVADKVDLCPNEVGEKGNNGCPRVNKEEQAVLVQAMKGLFFKSGSSIIKPESYAILDNVVSVLKNNEKIELSIEGHTDNTGNATSNLALSQNRATAARKYLIDKGIASTRVFAIGFGDSKPVADNTIEEGRVKNRRVEFVVLP